MGPTATFGHDIVIMQGRMKFSFFSYLSSISMLLDSSQTATPILTLYLSTLKGFNQNVNSIQKTKTRLKDFFKTNFCKYISKCLFLQNEISRTRLCFKKLSLQK
jgi:hypothetical protein